MSALEVRFADTLVGRLRADELDRLCFSYAEEWRASRQAFAISQSLPLRAEEYAGGAGHAFFANLLPEGEARQLVCNRLGISEGNDLALLRAIGGECAGALAIVEPGAAQLGSTARAPRYRELDDRALQELAAGEGVPLLSGGPSSRLSLAGAQHKLPVAVQEGRVLVPLDGTPSTHILKLPHRRFAHLPENEAFVLGLARRIGLEAVNAELLLRTDPPSLLIERRAQWEALSRELEVRSRVVTELVAELADRCLAELGPWTAEFRDRHARSSILQTLPRRIRRQTERLKRGLQ